MGLVIFQDTYGQTPQLLTQLGHQYPVTSIAVSDDGGLLASSDASGVINFWDVLNSKVIGNVKGFGPIRFSADGDILIANKFSQDKNSRALLFYSTESFLLVDKLPGTKLKNLALEDEYRIIPYKRKIKFKPLNRKNKKFIVKEEGGKIANYEISKALGKIAIGWKNGDLFLYDYHTGQKTETIRPKVYFAHNVAFTCPRKYDSFQFLQFSSSGKYLFSGNSRLIEIIDLERMEVVYSVGPSENLFPLIGIQKEKALQGSSRLFIQSAKKEYSSNDTITISQNDNENFFISNAVPLEHNSLSDTYYRLVDEMINKRISSIYDRFLFPKLDEMKLDSLLRLSNHVSSHFDSIATNYELLNVTPLFSKVCPCNEWINRPREKKDESQDGEKKVVKYDYSPPTILFSFQRNEHFNPVKIDPIWASETIDPISKPSALLPQVSRNTDFHPTVTGPLEASPTSDISLNLPYDPENSLFPYYYFYNCFNPEGSIVKDSLIEIAFHRQDQDLMEYFKSHEEYSNNKKSFLIKQKLLLRQKKVDRRVDTLKVEIFGSGNELNLSNKELKQWEKAQRSGPKVECLDMDPTEKYAALVIGLDSLVVYDLASGLPIVQKGVNKTRLNSIQFSPAGDYLYFGEEKGGIFAYNLPDWHPVRRFTQASFPVNQIRANDNLSGFMTGNFSREDGGGNFWDLNTGEKLGYINSSLFEMSRSGFDSTGKFLLMEALYKEGNQFKTTIIDFYTRNKVDIPVEFGVYREAVVIDSLSQIVVVGGTHDLGLIESREVFKYKKPLRWEDGKEMFTTVVYSPQGKKILASGRDGWLYSIALDPFSATPEMKISDFWVLDMKADTVRNLLYVTGMEGIVYVFELETLRAVRQSSSLGIPLKEIEVSLDGSLIAAADIDDNIFILNSQSLELVGELPWKDKKLERFTWGYNNQFLVTHGIITGLAQNGEGVISDHLYRLDSMVEETRFYPKDTIGLPCAISLHPYRPEVVIGGNGNPVTGYNLSTGKQIFECGYHSNFASQIIYFPDGNSFITASDEVDRTHENELRGTVHGSKVRMWDATTGFRKESMGGSLSGINYGGVPLLDYSNFRLVRKISFGNSGGNLILYHWNGGITVINLKMAQGQEVFRNSSNYYYGYQYHRSKLYEFYRNKYRIQKPNSGTGREILVAVSSGMERFNNSANDILDSELESESEEPTSGVSLKFISDQFIFLTERRQNHPGIHQEHGSENSQQKTLRIIDLGVGEDRDSIPKVYRFTNISENLPYAENLEKFKNNFKLRDKGLSRSVNENHRGDLNCIEKVGDQILLTSGGDAKTTIWDLKSQKPAVGIVSTSNNEGHLMFSPTNKYMVTPGAIDKVAFQFKEQTYPIEAFDLYMNRPDEIIGALPVQDTTIAEQYRAAHIRRLHHLGVDDDTLSMTFEVPIAKIITDKVELSTNEPDVQVHIIAKDTTGHPLIALEVWVDDVPVLGLNGVDLRGRNLYELDTVINIRLHHRSNKIQMSVTNSKLNRSFKETLLIERTSFNRKPNLYLVGLGVSEFDNINDLEFPAKDAKYLADFLQNGNYEGKDFYENIKTLVLTNDEVSLSNLELVSDFVNQAQEDDVVIFFLSGHGENSIIDYEYYFLTSHYNGDYKTGAFSYYMLDSMLAQSASRNKFMILNTCMSGEVDELSNTITPGEDFLAMKQLFLDLRRSSGATVFASSSGYGYLREVAGVERESGPLAYFLTSILKESKDPISIRELCDALIFLFKRRNSILDSEPEVRFSNLTRDFRIF